MTLDDATKIARIIEIADGGCKSCVSELAEALNEAFKEFKWSVESENFYGVAHPVSVAEVDNS